MQDSKLFASIDTIVCNLATNRNDLNAAFTLIYHKYLQAGLTRPSRVEMRIADFQLSTHCEIIVAKVNGQVVGTISMVAEIDGRLPLERAFPNALSDIRRQRLRAIEIGCLAAHEGNDGVFSPTFAALTQAVLQRARSLNYDRMVAAVHPRHGRFYTRAMGFERLGNPVRYESVEGNLAVCVAGDPSNRLNYKSPWRELFFDASTALATANGQAISQFDRNFYLSLKSVVARSADLRAA